MKNPWFLGQTHSKKTQFLSFWTPFLQRQPYTGNRVKKHPKIVILDPPPQIYRLLEVLILELPLGFGVSWPNPGEIVSFGPLFWAFLDRFPILLAWKMTPHRGGFWTPFWGHFWPHSMVWTMRPSFEWLFAKIRFKSCFGSPKLLKIDRIFRFCTRLAVRGSRLPSIATSL